MTSWTIKTVTDDKDRALKIVQDQWNRGYVAWIEDENGRAVDAEALKIGKLEQPKPSLYVRAMGPLVVIASSVAAIGILYLLGVWVDR